jgi:hypothetical protein
VTQEIYSQRLDSLLELGRETDSESLAAAGLTQAGQELMNIWSDMDKGKVKTEAAFAAADKAVRNKQVVEKQS